MSCGCGPKTALRHSSVLARWEAIQPKGITVKNGRRIGGRNPNNPDRYPFFTRVIDLTDGCFAA
ncbi:MAG: hypothetical protein DWI23_01980 [Planctomycetota bacterium]|nr:MAG: hypothetical protein DWI23_01980 [Planctomycetota bacterium]